MEEDDEYLYLREKVWLQMELEYKQNFELQMENQQKPAKIELQYDKRRMGEISPVAEKRVYS